MEKKLETISQRIRHILIVERLTQKGMSDKLNSVSPSTISVLCTRFTHANLSSKRFSDVIQQICDTFGYNVSWIVFGTGDMKKAEYTEDEATKINEQSLLMCEIIRKLFTLTKSQLSDVKCYIMKKTQ